MTVHELIIIGSGPAGYTAAIYAARAALNPVVFEGALDSGGALMNTTEVENFPGFPDGVMGPDLMGQMRVEAVDLTGKIKKVTDSAGKIWEAKAVILAMGSGYRKLGVEGEEQLSGRGVSWCATCDGAFFRDKPIAVIGGGDSAVEEATFLTRFASRVTLVHRRDELRASKAMVARAEKDPKLDFAWNSVVESINGDARVESVTLRDTVTGEHRQLEVSGVFVAIGHDPRSTLVTGQVELDEAGYVKVVAGSQATNLPGVFACGDLVDHTYRQAITAAGSGCRAALDAERWLAANEA